MKTEQIDVIVHAQSIISIVQFEDGSMKAQMGLPDMRLPIQYALSHPQTKSDFETLILWNIHRLLLKASIKHSVTLHLQPLQWTRLYTALSNAANEIAVDAFLHNKIRFTDMPELIQYCMKKFHSFSMMIM